MSNSTEETCVPSSAAFYINVVAAVLAVVLQLVTGLVPNIKALQDIFRAPENHRRDTAVIQQKLEQVVKSITPPNSTRAV